MHISTDIPEIEPSEVTAGDTWKWKKDLSAHYSAADSWVLTYHLLGPQPITITASADGVKHSVSVAASTTAGYAPGLYKWQSYASKAGERFKVEEGTLEVLQNPATVKGLTEARSDARVILDTLMEAYKANAGREHSSYSLQALGRSFNFKSHAELIAAIQFWQGEVAREDRAEKIRRGLGAGNRVLVRFRR